MDSIDQAWEAYVRQRIVVIAGSYIECCRWIQMNQQSPNEIIYADCPADLDGVDIGVVIRTGNYWMNPLSSDPALLEIEESLKQRWRSE